MVLALPQPLSSESRFGRLVSCPHSVGERPFTMKSVMGGGPG